MKNRLTYLTFRNTLKSFYSEKDLIHLFRAVKKMDDESKRWVADWIEGKGYPKVTIEKINISFLVNELKFKPMNAFIILDWLKRDPEHAKYCLQRYDENSGIPDSELKKMKLSINDEVKDDFDAENEFVDF